MIARFSRLARELGVVVPVSFFERAGQAFFNSVAVIDADGAVLGLYRKSHIPDAIGYQEKYYFSPGDTGFRVWDTRHGRVGVGICWDQWFPESARCMALLGAEAEMLSDDGRPPPWLDGFLFALAGPIYAGTNEIQRNVVAERVLGLPRA